MLGSDVNSSDDDNLLEFGNLQEIVDTALDNNQKCAISSFLTIFEKFKTNDQAEHLENVTVNQINYHFLIKVTSSFIAIPDDSSSSGFAYYPIEHEETDENNGKTCYKLSATYYILNNDEPPTLSRQQHTKRVGEQTEEAPQQLKLITLNDPNDEEKSNLKEKSQREQRAWGNAPDIFEVETENTYKVGCMRRYVEGQSLQERIEPTDEENQTQDVENAIPSQGFANKLNTSLTIFFSMLERLQKLYSKGVVHNHLNPAHVIVANNLETTFISHGHYRKTGESTNAQTNQEYLPADVKNNRVRKCYRQHDLYACGLMFSKMLFGANTTYEGENNATAEDIFKAKLAQQLGVAVAQNNQEPTLTGNNEDLHTEQDNQNPPEQQQELSITAIHRDLFQLFNRLKNGKSRIEDIQVHVCQLWRKNLSHITPADLVNSPELSQRMLNYYWRTLSYVSDRPRAKDTRAFDELVKGCGFSEDNLKTIMDKTGDWLNEPLNHSISQRVGAVKELRALCYQLRGQLKCENNNNYKTRLSSIVSNLKGNLGPENGGKSMSTHLNKVIWLLNHPDMEPLEKLIACQKVATHYHKTLWQSAKRHFSDFFSCCRSTGESRADITEFMSLMRKVNLLKFGPTDDELCLQDLLGYLGGNTPHNVLEKLQNNAGTRIIG